MKQDYWNVRDVVLFLGVYWNHNKLYHHGTNSVYLFFSGLPLVHNLKTRLLALRLLETILPATDSSKYPDLARNTINQLFHNVSETMWTMPAAVAKQQMIEREAAVQMQLNALKDSSSPMASPSGEEDQLMAMQEALFDGDRTLCCKVEAGHTLVHGSGGRGYGLGATAIASGCYQWKVRLGS